MLYNMTSNLYFCNPLAQFNSHKQEISEAITRVCNSGYYVLGPEVDAFETEFAAYHAIGYCVGVGSGTDALSLTLKAFDVGQGDEVITVSHTALATAAAIVSTGATPVLVDIEEDYFTMDPLKIEAAVTQKTKAIMPVHLYGQPCDMAPIMTIAAKYNLRVIEDCAQAHGATYQGRKVGTIGDAGCFSFYPTKNLGAIGDGGGVISNNKQVCERLKRLRQYGWDSNRVSQEPSTVSRLDELQAAILRVKLRHLDTDNEKRRNTAQYYRYLLDGSDIFLPQERPNCHHVYHLYVVRSSTRNRFNNELAKCGIQAGIHYSDSVHRHPGYAKKVEVKFNQLRVTEKIVHEILSLPIYPELDKNMLDGLKEFLHV